MDVTISNRLQLSAIPADLEKELIAKLQLVNPKWIENERMGRWNQGTPKILKFFYKSKNGNLSLPRGFMRQLLILGRQCGEEIKIIDKRRKLTEIDFSFKGHLKPFQQTAVATMLQKDFGTLSAPTGSGKTVIALFIIAQRRQPALVIVHTKELALQWMDRIGTFLAIPENEIGLIGNGKKKVGARITVALVQSLYKCASDVAKSVGHLIVDECHRAPSRTFTEAVKAFDTKYMLGLSATPWRRDQLSKLIYWHLGDVHHEVEKANLVAQGHILDLEVIMRPTDFKPYYDPVTEYSKMLSELCNDDERNHLIVDDIAKEVKIGNTRGAYLVLSDRKKHCNTLQSLLKHKHQIAADVLTGDLPLDTRRSIIDRLQHGQMRVLIATGQLIGEGFDCPSLSMLFMATPVRFSGRVLQYLGRILRPVEGVLSARVYDYVDINVGPLEAAANARQRLYASRK